MSRFTQSTAAVLVACSLVLTAAGCASTKTSESAGEYVDDAAITTAVKSKMIADKSVKARDIQVDTYRGTVQLSGFADDSAQVSRAVEIARETKGVKAVKNDVRIKPAPAADAPK